MIVNFSSRLLALPLVAAVLLAVPVSGDSRAPVLPAPAVTYADLADLADGARLVVRAQPRKVSQVEAARARGLRAGWGRFYVEAKTQALITGSAPLGEALRYLVDMPLDTKGKPPAIKKNSVVLFARTVAGRPGELQLVAPDAQLMWDPALDARLKSVLRELFAPGAPQKITGVREAVHVTGELAGAGETQIFLVSGNDEPAALSVSRTPGAEPRWGASFSELVASDGAPPRDSLAWYRLACFLPAELSLAANRGETQALREAAALDYAYVRSQLGPCARLRR